MVFQEGWSTKNFWDFSKSKFQNVSQLEYTTYWYKKTPQNTCTGNKKRVILIPPIKWYKKNESILFSC
jgi:hypothetical protein